jgi:hypothetical protein
MHDRDAKLLREIVDELREIECEIHHENNQVTGGIICQIGNEMPLLPIAPGNSPQFQVTPAPVGVVTVIGQSAWNVTNVKGGPSTSGAVATANSADPTGCTVTVVIDTAAPTPFSDLLVWVYTNSDGTTATANFALTDTSTAPVVNVTGGTIAQIV